MRAFPVSPNIRSGSCHSTTGQTGCAASPDQPDRATITERVICGDFSSPSDSSHGGIKFSVSRRLLVGFLPLLLIADASSCRETERSEKKNICSWFLNNYAKDTPRRKHKVSAGDRQQRPSPLPCVFKFGGMLSIAVLRSIRVWRGRSGEGNDEWQSVFCRFQGSEWEPDFSTAEFRDVVTELQD